MSNLGDAASAVEIASQTGRLDLLSAILAVLALLLGLLAFPVFFFVRRRAEEIAREEAKKTLDGALERIEKEAVSTLESMLPTLYEEYSEMARRAVTDEAANRIAAAQGDGASDEDSDRQD